MTKEELFWRVFLILYNYFVEIGKVKEPTDEDLLNNMKGVEGSVDNILKH